MAKKGRRGEISPGKVGEAGREARQVQGEARQVHGSARQVLLPRAADSLCL